MGKFTFSQVYIMIVICMIELGVPYVAGIKGSIFTYRIQYQSYFFGKKFFLILDGVCGDSAGTNRISNTKKSSYIITLILT